ncbi:ABC transporter ATP-binding protein [Paenibacillus caseinilyticus]|uniref:ABC transporter ATP-binding protein n=1 Tax=Paenibacillus mucilaginosus K02 TaxID=997761 RepID=I0BML7_9BACL|nr:ABC transporter ATP-binding protein [Paenibacillus mucilaginosus]AFH63614.2 ABC transporter ATP-binding protein [Paenibacillus mucilaginosus K02]
MSFKQAYAEFGQLMAYMKPRARTYYAGMIGESLVSAALAILLSFVIQYLLNYAVHRDPSELQRAVYLVCGTVGVLSILSPICNYLFLKCIKITMGEIRTELFGHIARIDYRSAESRHSGDLLSRITNDVQSIEMTYAEHIKSIVSQILLFIGSSVVVFIVDWRFALVLLALGGFSVLLNTRFSAPLRRVSDELQAQMGVLTERIGDLIAGLQVIKLFGLQQRAGRLSHDAIAAVSRSGIRQGHQAGLLEAGNFLIQFLSLGGVLLIGLLMVSSGQLELGVLGQIVQLQSGIAVMFLSLGTSVAMMQNSYAGLTRIREVLAVPVESERHALQAVPSPEEKTAVRSDAALQLTDVTFGYDANRPVLKELSLSLAEGTVTALVGPSGGGKSTVVKLLLGFYPPDSGTVWLGGRPAGSCTLQEIREQMAYVPQEATLFQGTIADNIRFGSPDASDSEVEAAARAAYAHGFITELPQGYDTPVGERGANLSGGQRQRIAIARALLKNSPILLLDEATSALDAESEHEVQQALQVLMKGRTTLVVAHRLSTIENADRICVIAGGRVQEEGTHEELLAMEGQYADLYHLQFRKKPPELAVS